MSNRVSSPATRFSRSALVALLALGVAACGASVVPVPAPADAERAAARWADADLDQLTAGRTLYVQKCSGCHTLVAPHARSPEAWPAMVDAMARRIRLGDPERDLITRYVVTMSELRGVAPSAPSARAAEPDPAAADVGPLGQPQVDAELR